MPLAGTAMPAPLTVLSTPISATLAANEAMDVRRRRGLPVLPLAFGEAGLPVHPALRAALSAATASNGYGPVAGLPALRAAAAGYWGRRALPTSPDQVVCGPGSKALIFGVLLALGQDVAVPRPSWVSYAAQAGLINANASCGRSSSRCRTTRPARWPGRRPSRSSVRSPPSTT
jgi:aspartate aminotransferase